MTVKAASRVESEAATKGAKAGAKARRREAEEAADQTSAVLQVERSGEAATWTRTYRAGTLEDGSPDRRTVTMRETGRREVDGAELLKLTGEAVRLAAARLANRHNVPELSADERADYRSALVAKLLGDVGKGRMPERAKLTRAYLVKRAEGLVLNDPHRVNADADSDGMDPEAIAANSEARARDKHDRHDPMLNRGVDGSWSEVVAGCAATPGVSERAARTAAYMVAGGSVRLDWSEVWGVSEGYAATRLVPEGAALLRTVHLNALDQSPLYLAIQKARTEDRDELDAAAARRRWIESGMTEAPRKPRATPDRRWRTEPDEPAPVTSRTDRRIIVRSDRTRENAARRAGWTTPRA